MIVVYGNTSSGKSMTAESICLALSADKKRYYLATMENTTDAAKERIDHHKKLREGKGFETVEDMYLDTVRTYDGFVLLECVSNLLANVMYASYGDSDIEDKIEILADEIVNRISLLDKNSNGLVVVTNNVFGNGKHEDIWCDQYMRCLGLINIKLAKLSECFIEVSNGCELVIKGEKIWQ